MSQQALVGDITPQKLNGKSLSFPLGKALTDEYLQFFSWSLRDQVKKFLTDWKDFKDGMENWNFWRPPMMKATVSNGLGQRGTCPFHGYPHPDFYPQGGSPVICHEAKMMAMGK